MAETNETVVDDIEAEDAAAAADDVFTVDDESDLIDDEPEEAATEAESESTEEATATTQAFQHSPELIEKAVNALFTVEEIAGMSPEALRIAINGAHRIAQVVVEHGKKATTEKPAEAVDELAVLDDPELYNQDVVKPIKGALAKLADRMEKLEKENVALRQKAGQSEAQVLHTRLMGLASQVSPDVVKEFDVATPAGRKKYEELTEIMGAVWRKNQTMPEPQLLRRALKAMDIVPEKPEKPADSPELAAKKNEWDKGSLAGNTTRKKATTAEDRVGEILQAIKAQRKPMNGTKPKK